MATSPPGMLRTAILIAAVFGMVWLAVAVDCLLAHLDKFPTTSGPVYLILGSSLFGAISLAASWLLYRPRSWSVPFYGASWSLNVIGYLAVGLAAPNKPASYVYLAAGCLTYLALTLIIGVRRELRPYAIAP